MIAANRCLFDAGTKSITIFKLFHQLPEAFLGMQRLGLAQFGKNSV
jgi:hypothetical protein